MLLPPNAAFGGRQVNEIIVHSSATPASNDKIDAKEIDRWHRARGWNGIGYNFVIKRDGTVEAGRPLDRAGAHTLGHNANSIGICMVGGVASDGKTPEANFTPEQLVNLRVVVDFYREMFPHAVLGGHRDFNATECPSFDVATWWKTNKVVP